MAEERIQRRLVAILAADVAGYSRLMETDEAGTLAALKSRRKNVLDPLVAKHQGRIFKTAGDGVLVEFASAVNAVQCAVDLQQGMTAANANEPYRRRRRTKPLMEAAALVAAMRRSPLQRFPVRGRMKTKLVALYMRVSTDGQTTENQRRELVDVAGRHGWQIVETFINEGISGAKARRRRPSNRASETKSIDQTSFGAAAWMRSTR